jgi:hypothetical protein
MRGLKVLGCVCYYTPMSAGVNEGLTIGFPEAYMMLFPLLLLAYLSVSLHLVISDVNSCFNTCTLSNPYSHNQILTFGLVLRNTKFNTYNY